MDGIDIDHPETQTPANKRIYALRRRNFRRNLTATITQLGFTLIVLQYVKYGTSILTVATRSLIQSLLSAPFPPNDQLRNIAISDNPRTNNNNTESTTTTTASGNNNRNGLQFNRSIRIPGLFEPQNTQPVNNEINESQVDEEVRDLKYKIKIFIFYSSMGLGFVLLFLAILFPRNFILSTNGKILNDSDLELIPFPYNAWNELVVGERKNNGFFLQMIGEQIPRSNVRGNIGMVMFDFFIIIAQFTLFMLTCVDESEEIEETDDVVGDINEHDLLQLDNGDGYDGKVSAVKLHFVDGLKLVVDKDDQGISNGMSGMV